MLERVWLEMEDMDLRGEALGPLFLAGVNGRLERMFLSELEGRYSLSPW